MRFARTIWKAYVPAGPIYMVGTSTLTVGKFVYYADCAGVKNCAGNAHARDFAYLFIRPSSGCDISVELCALVLNFSTPAGFIILAFSPFNGPT